MIRRNKKGAMVLRDIMFMVVVFAAIMALASVLVKSVGEEYVNTQMVSDYNGDDSVGELGDDVLVEVSSSTEIMKTQTDGDEGLLGSFGSLTGIIFGAPKILYEIIKTPVYIGSAISTMMVALGIPSSIVSIVWNSIIIIIYLIIISVIVSALLKGGKV